MIEIEKLNGLLWTETEEEWRDYLFELCKTLGFDCIFYGALASKTLPIENAFICTNFPLSWSEQYVSDRLWNVDPTIRHCFKSESPFVWGRESLAGLGLDDAFKFGQRSGITFPFHGCRGEVAMITFSAGITKDKFISHAFRLKAVLSLVRDYTFQSSLKFLKPPQKDPVPALTKRQLEILKWIMVGKSSWVISRILNCSESTVNFHVEKLRRKFDVGTRQQVIVQAIALGTIIPEDSP